ncbi:hypothetical protein GS426_09325 [Rhodococcus hoagii]|nr:hypothetical protein [Prescottella equi]
MAAAAGPHASGRAFGDVPGQPDHEELLGGLHGADAIVLPVDTSRSASSPSRRAAGTR